MMQRRERGQCQAGAGDRFSPRLRLDAGRIRGGGLNIVSLEVPVFVQIGDSTERTPRFADHFSNRLRLPREIAICPTQLPSAIKTGTQRLSGDRTVKSLSVRSET